MMSSKLWVHGENWPQRFDLSLPLYDLSLDIMVPGVWQNFGADCAVILRYCKSKSGKKYRSYCTLNHQRILNLQFALFFKGLKRGFLDKIRCSQWLQGMVLDGIEGYQWKNSRSTTFNFKSDAWSCVLSKTHSSSAVACLMIIHVTLSSGNGRCDAGILLCNTGAVTCDTRSAPARPGQDNQMGEFY